MRLNLVASLLALVAIGTARAEEEPPIPGELVEAAAEQAAPPSATAAEQTVPVEAEPMGSEPAPEPVTAEVPMPEAATAEAAMPENPPGGELAGDAARVEPAEPVNEAPVLGAVGYDSKGRVGRIHIVIPSDTLWDISEAYLGTPWVWPTIWQDNDDIANPHLIYPNDHIWITPWEMRRVSPEEAAQMMAGQPAAPEEAPIAPELVLEPPVVEIPVARSVTMRVSGRETVGLITRETLESSASIVSAVPTRLMLGQGDRVYIGLGADDVQVGDQFTVFRAREKVFDPDTRRLLGYHVDLLGWTEVTEPHGDTSTAEIRMSSAEIEVGDRLMRRTPPVIDIPIQTAPDGVDGKISFFAQSRTVMGSQDFVYLNRGTRDGVEVGSPLEVYRDGYRSRERTRGDTVHVPERVVAKLLVVRAQPATSVARVESTEEELAVGDSFRGAVH
jgi:hypothetical protein